MRVECLVYEFLDVILEQEKGLIECSVNLGFGACGFGGVGDTPV